ncbi:enoyl-CoA hydratase [Pandoraea terrae]|uniref:Enoyl-CoA hydratase n=1 Tax=Pandoraea terrae TaxID=1537710 RepID=A0A5E4UX28_9BURK|nr:enoyl-CoA hydratase/isomerase family protein [Pandoraea terrae]VVE03659.1 enoyl-CoA hydratase [Pandoraea terrae]
MQTTHDILVETNGQVRVITLNRPHRLNAWTDSMRAEVCAAFSEAECDDSIGAIVITGSGERAFCSGQDFNEVHDHDAQTAAIWMATWEKFFDVFRSASKPVVAALNGLAVGSAFQVALLCDLRIAHPGVRLGQPEINQGVVSITGPWIMREMLGLSRTVELVLTGRLMDCEESARLGLVHEVVSAAEVLPRALAIAEELAAKPRTAMQRNKAWLRQLTEPGFREAAAEAIRAHADVFASGEPSKHMKQFLKSDVKHA